MTAAYRKCNGMPLEQIIDEYVAYAGGKARNLDIFFIRAFDEYEYLWSTTIKEGVPLTGSSATEMPIVIPSPLSPVLKAKM